MSNPDFQPRGPCFIDTNIWLYSFIRTQDEEKFHIARNVIANANIIISTQVINEICVNLLKKADFSEEKIQGLIASFYRRYNVIELTQTVLMKASEVRNEFMLSFWDSLIVASALDSEAEFLISEDMQHGFVFYNQLTIINPALL